MPMERLSIAEQATDLAEKAMASGQFALADQLAKLATAEAARSRNKEVIAAARNRRKEVQAAMKLATEFKTASAQLGAQPDDPAANLTVGTYYCFLMGEWEQGLPYLAKGQMPALGSLRGQELEKAPSDAAQRVKVADAWWDLAQGADGWRKKNILLHARSWYVKAQPDLSPGLMKTKVDKRLEEIEKIDRRLSPQPPSEM